MWIYLVIYTSIHHELYYKMDWNRIKKVVCIEVFQFVTKIIVFCAFSYSN